MAVFTMFLARLWLAPAAFATGVADTGAPTGDTGPDPATDDDGDGWTIGDGDCDDADRDVNPGERDVCFDGIDNDCTSLADELCDNSARIGSLRGGGACTGGAGIAGTATALFVPLLLVARRRRGAR
jgi:hypothetical protein